MICSQPRSEGRRRGSQAAALEEGAGHVLRGHVQGRGRIDQQTFIDTYAKGGFAKLYDRRTRLTAADLLNDRCSRSTSSTASR